MIVSRKTEKNIVCLKLSLLNEESLFQGGFKKWETNNFLPPIHSNSLKREGYSKTQSIPSTNRYPKNNSSVFRIFNAISKGNWDEVNFSIQFVSFQDSYYNNHTASIASLFCEHPMKRKMIMKTIMKWKFNFKIPDLIFLRDPLHWCCVLKYKDEYDLIIDYLGGDVDYHSKDVDGNTYLHLAVISNSLDLVKSISKDMVVKEISADVSNLLGFTPYILSRKLGFRDISTYIQSTKIASLNVFDNLFYMSPREWSIVGHNDKLNSLEKLKANKYDPVKPFVKMPEIVHGVRNEPKPIDINKIIHSAYIIWADQHVDSFRKLARSRQRLAAKSKFNASLPPAHKKQRRNDRKFTNHLKL